MVKIPRSEFPQKLIKPEKRRRIVGTDVTKIDKTDSTLHLIGNQERRNILRNGEIGQEPMSIWEFTHTYAHEFFSSDVAQELFGIWGRIQVAPILKRKNKNRIYRRNGENSAYSEVAGLDTYRLAELWNIKDILAEYTFQQHNQLGEERWVGSICYWLTKDLAENIPEIGNNGELLELLEKYWEEFIKLNIRKVGRKDLLLNRELRRQEMEPYDSYNSSILLIKIGHKITEILREEIKKLNENPKPNLKWKNKPVLELLALVLHLNQTVTQESLLWWFGISHGHLHYFNSVARVDENETDLSLLETKIIDFDRAKINIPKLQENNELYQVIDSKKLKNKILDDQLDINIRLQFILYLPLRDWDNEIFDLLEKFSGKEIVVQIVRLITARLVKDITNHEKFSRLINFVYQYEKEQIKNDEPFPVFPLTISLLKETKIELKDSNLEVMQQYLKTGFSEIIADSLDEKDKLFLISLIFFNGTQKINKIEFKWLIMTANKHDLVSNHAKSLIKILLESYSENLITSILEEVEKGEKQDLELVIELIYFTYNREQESAMEHAQESLMEKLIESGQLIFILDLVDLKRVNLNLYYNLYRHIDKAYLNKVGSYDIDDDKNMTATHKKRKEMLSYLDKKLGLSRARTLVLFNKIRNFFSPK